jgi:hypothetical protein
MRTRSKLTLAGLTASLLMGLAVSSASANELKIADTTGFRVTWTAFNLQGVEAGVRVICPVTLEGTFHSTTLQKRAGALIGFITRAAVNGAEPPCTGGRATILQEHLPWHLTYEAFTGTLPDIEFVTLLLRRFAYRVETTVLGFRIACLYEYQGRPEENLAGNLSIERPTGGQIRELRLLTNRYVSWRSGSELCPRRATPSGTGVVTRLNNSLPLTLLLI